MYYPYGALLIPLYIFALLLYLFVQMAQRSTHRCCLQYIFFNPLNSHCNFLLLFHFIYCTTFDTERWGSTDTSICTWSELTFPLIILTQLPLYIFQQYYRIILCTYTLYKILCEFLLYVILYIILKYSPKGEGVHPSKGLEIKYVRKQRYRCKNCDKR